MKKVIVVIVFCLLYVSTTFAQNAEEGKSIKTNDNSSVAPVTGGSNFNHQYKSNSGLFKLKPGEQISSENKSTKTNKNLSNLSAQSRAEDYYNVDFQNYIKKVNVDITNNDQSITELKSVLWGKDTKDFRRAFKYVSSLEKENEELKTDLDNYIKYGLGSWKIFQKEFSHDLSAVVSDISVLDQMYLPGNLLSANSK